MKYFIVVVCEDHCVVGIEEGIIQACHGKLSPMQKLKHGDKVILYAPRVSISSSILSRKFISIGTVKDEELYQLNITEDFSPFRRNVEYDKSLKPVYIYDILDLLDLTKNNKNWGIKFRYGFFEISENDFNTIYNHMK